MAPPPGTPPGFIDDDLVEAMRREWTGLRDGSADVEAWETKAASMQGEMAALKSARLWRALDRRRTLLHAMGLHHDEVRLCRALAWVLTPYAPHGLEAEMLMRLLDEVGIETDVDDMDRVTVVTEEGRNRTFADLIVRLPSATVLIEAKVWAGEQESQADRLAEEWAELDPVLVFLTRDGRAPTTAVRSTRPWLPLTWRRVGAMLEAAAEQHPDCAAGVRELIATLEEFGGDG